jgi:hypothetical protein
MCLIIKLNIMMAKNGVHNTNIKGFKVDTPQANWNVV